MQMKYKATAALCISAAGFLAAYPFQHTFWGGLASGGCLAAVIGGLADWFAVTALFKKPLGISYRTEIIPRNRERLLHEMIEFTAADLLNPANIMQIVERYDMAKMLLFYLEEAEGKEHLKTVAKGVALRLLETLDRQALAAEIGKIAKKGLEKTQAAPLVEAALEGFLERKYDDQAVGVILREAAWIVRDPDTQEIFADVIRGIKMEYEDGSARRQMMNLFVDLSPERLAGTLQEEAAQALEKLQDANHPVRRRFREWLLRQTRNKEVFAAAEKWRKRLIEEELNLDAMILSRSEAFFAAHRREWLQNVDDFIEKEYYELKTKKHVQENIDRAIKSYIEMLISENHAMITQVVQERMAEFSDEALVGFVEARIADDLQMIRINGSLIGALAGIGLYVLTCAVERMWG